MSHDLEDWNRLIGCDFDSYSHVEPFWERREREIKRYKFRRRCQQIGLTMLCWAVIIGLIWLRFK